MSVATACNGWQRIYGSVALLLALLLFGCGGSSNSGTPNPPPAAAPQPTVAELATASKFAARATFGLPFGEIEAIARQSREQWLERQFALVPGLHMPIVANLMTRREAGEFTAFEEDIEFLLLFRRLAWWHRTITSPDVLRQRVAFALSEIFVVSDKLDQLVINPFALSGYYDMLLEGAFGNYRDLLRSVTLHPAMGIYLSHANNRKGDAQKNTFPDENYAREVMQLFSIGLFELNTDGTRKLDAAGQPIPTYSNVDIREFAKIFTGLSYAGALPYFGNPEPDFFNPMTMFDAAHEPGPKRLLNDTVVPAGQGGMADIEAAINNLFQHPNVGPFIGRQLIQRLVTSNPSPAYVERVARVFNGESSGVRGDLKAVITAILLDAEALAATDPARHFGKLREPVVRYASILRQFGARSDDGFIANSGFFLEELGKQHPLSAFSVFNFFLPAHAPTGEIAAAGLVAPEFEITTSSSIVGLSNLVDFIVLGEFATDAPAPFMPATLDLEEYVALAPDLGALIVRLDILLTGGTLAPATRQAMEGVLGVIDEPEIRLRIALYMFLISPDYAVRL